MIRQTDRQMHARMDTFRHTHIYTHTQSGVELEQVGQVVLDSVMEKSQHSRNSVCLLSRVDQRGVIAYS